MLIERSIISREKISRVASIVSGAMFVASAGTLVAREISRKKERERNRDREILIYGNNNSGDFDFSLIQKKS